MESLAITCARQRLHDQLVTAGIPIDGVSGQGPFAVQYSASATAQQRSQGDSMVAAFVVNDDATEIATRQRADADGDFDAAADLGRLLRAVAAVLVDEINALREWDASLAAAVAAATSLADLKTRVAALPALPDHTLAQARAAILNKISANT